MIEIAINPFYVTGIFLCLQVFNNIRAVKFYFPWNDKKTYDFLMISEGIEAI